VAAEQRGAGQRREVRLDTRRDDVSARRLRVLALQTPALDPVLLDELVGSVGRCGGCLEYSLCRGEVSRSVRVSRATAYVWRCAAPLFLRVHESSLFSEVAARIGMGAAGVWLSHRNQDRDEPIKGAPRAGAVDRAKTQNKQRATKGGSPVLTLSGCPLSRCFTISFSSAAAEGACSSV